MTVADPPRMSIDDTIMFVASLVAQQVFSFTRRSSDFSLAFHAPEKHEHKVCKRPPARANDLKPRVRVGRVQLQLGRQLREQEDLHRRARAVPPRPRNPIFIRDGTRLQLHVASRTHAHQIQSRGTLQ